MAFKGARVNLRIFIVLSLSVVSAAFFYSIRKNNISYVENKTERIVPDVKTQEQTKSSTEENNYVHPLSSKNPSVTKKLNMEEYSNSQAFKRYALGPDFLRPYFAIKQKALLNRQDKIQLEELLSSEALFDKCLEKLSSIDSIYDEYQEKDRIMAIKFISQAMKWKENPLRDDLLKKISKFLTGNPTPKKADLKTKKSVAGDRVELFLSLYDQDSSIAFELIEENKGSKSEQLFQYALRTYRKI